MNLSNEPDTTTKITLTIIGAVLLVGAAFGLGPLYIDVGDSMEPTIHEPALVVCNDINNPGEQLEEGDIVGYYSDGTLQQHRVTDVSWRGENRVVAARDNPADDGKDIVRYDHVKCRTDAYINLHPAAW